jgi:hypothetical protein
MIDAEGAALIAELFNIMTLEQKNDEVPNAIATRIGRFMYRNGYRFVHDKLYLPAKPKEE